MEEWKVVWKDRREKGRENKDIRKRCYLGESVVARMNK